MPSYTIKILLIPYLIVVLLGAAEVYAECRVTIDGKPASPNLRNFGTHYDFQVVSVSNQILNVTINITIDTQESSGSQYFEIMDSIPAKQKQCWKSHSESCVLNFPHKVPDFRIVYRYTERNEFFVVRSEGSDVCVLTIKTTRAAAIDAVDLPQCHVLVNGKDAMPNGKYHYLYYMVFDKNKADSGLHLSFILPVTQTDDEQIFGLGSKDAQFVNTDKKSQRVNHFHFATERCDIKEGLTCTLNYTFYNASQPNLNSNVQNFITDHLQVSSNGVSVCSLDIRTSTYPEAIEIHLSWVPNANNTYLLNADIIKGFPPPITLDDLICDKRKVKAQKLPLGYNIHTDELRKYNNCEVTARTVLSGSEVTEEINVTEEIKATVPYKQKEYKSNMLFTVGIAFLGCIVFALAGVITYRCRKPSVTPIVVNPANDVINPANVVVNPANDIINSANFVVNDNPDDAELCANENYYSSVDGQVEDEHGHIPDHSPSDPVISIDSSDTSSSGFDETDGPSPVEASPNSNTSAGRNAPFNNHIYPTAKSVESADTDNVNVPVHVENAPTTSSNIVHPSGEDKVGFLDENQ